MEVKEKSIVKSEKGITLIALVVTIVVLLILAAVSISMLGGENGIITQAIEAKDETTIGEEKEKVQLAATAAKTKNNWGEITEENLSTELDNNIGNGKYKLSKSGDKLIITYNDSNRSYKIDDNGNVMEIKTIEVYIDYKIFIIEENTVWEDFLLSIKKSMEKYNIQFNSIQWDDGKIYQEELKEWYRDYFKKEANSSNEYYVFYRIIQYTLYDKDREFIVPILRDDFNKLLEMMNKAESGEEITDEEYKFWEDLYSNLIAIDASSIIENKYAYIFSWDM